jgi:hypothetical protein
MSESSIKEELSADFGGIIFDEYFFTIRFLKSAPCTALRIKPLLLQASRSYCHDDLCKP